MDPRTWLVSGGTGLIGGRLLDAVTGDGDAVRALTRNAAAAERSLPPGASAVAWDGVQVPAGAAAGADAVVHLAGEPIFGGPLTGERRRRVVTSRVDSTRSLVEGLAALAPDARPAVLVNASAVGIYGDRGEEELDEDAAPGEGFLAELCRDWEAAALAARDLGVRVVALRIGVVLAREGGALRMMALPFRFGLGGRLGNGRQWFPWVHADDLVALIRACVDDAGYDGPVNGVAPEPVRNADLTRVLGRTLRRPALLPAPGFAVRAALGELAGELLGSRRVLPQRALERGFRFAYPTLVDALTAELG